MAITYDAAGERIGAAYADGHTESYSYNADGYLTDVYISPDGKDADKGGLKSQVQHVGDIR